MIESTSSSVGTDAPEPSPSVLAILVVPSAEPWLRACLQALAAQSYPRLGVLAIDDGSGDEANELLVHALGRGRVVRNGEPLGIARSLAAALALPVAAAADHVLLLHADTVLDPDAVARLVEATAIAGIEGVGIVGAKVVDHEHPRRLLDVGRSVDRFGHAIGPLQAGEIDQGQFDRVLEVLAVDGCAMLVARNVWQAVGSFDERLGLDASDLCWRVRIAGWRVLMTPLARVGHREHVERTSDHHRGERYHQDRVALASVLKNDGWVTLLWVLPLGALLTLVRLLFLILGRRFEEAFDLAAAVGWNITHLPGTLRRRRAAQKARRVRDHALHRFTSSAGLHLPRWFQTAERILEERREPLEEEGEPTPRRLGHRTASFVSVHPVLVTSFIGLLVGVFAVRSILASPILVGGVIPAFPSTPNGFFQELVSGFRSTGLGGSLAASPALAALGAISYGSLASTSLAQKVVLIGAPVLAVILCYRAAMRRTGKPGPAAVAAAAYGMSALMLWAFSEGRIAVLAMLVIVPPLVERIDVAFRSIEPDDGRWRFTVGLAVTMAVGIAFVPALAVVAGLVLVVSGIFGHARARGLGLVMGAAIGAMVLVFPFVPTVTWNGGLALWSGIGSIDPWDVLKLSLGAAPGDWNPAFFLPIAALLGLALAGGEHRGRAARAAITAAIAVPLAWLSVAGYLPTWAANAPAYAVLAAACEAFLIGDGLASAIGGIGRATFGFRQIGSALVAITLALGLSLQAMAAMVGDWAIGGPDRIPAAWAVVDSAARGSFNVLWLAKPDGGPFPAPGGDPTGVADAGPATVTIGLTDREGVLAVDTGRPLTGSGEPALQAALGEILSGTTVHGGSLLAPFAVRFLVAEQDRLPVSAFERFQAQADLELVPATDLVIWRNLAALPRAGVLEADKATRATVRSSDPAVIQRFVPVPTTPLDATESGWSGPAGEGTLPVVATEFDGAWRLEGSSLEGSSVAPERAFGWSTAFATAPPDVAITYGAQWPRTVAIWLLAVVWAIALWITRKPVRR
jgi:hypothetical protein